MQTMNSNKKSLNTETSNTGDRPMSQKVRQIFDEIESMASEGSSIEEVVYTIMSSGQVDQSEMSNALEHLGYTPDAIVDLFQKVEILEREMLAQQQSQQQQPQQQPQQSEDVSAQELDAMAEQAAQQLLQGEQQPQMQFGGVTNKGTGLLSQYDPVPHPVYLPPLPRRGNLLGAAYLLDDALGTFFNNKDRDGDGVMDGSFRDWKAKDEIYKNKQLKNRTYEVDYGDLNPKDYIPTWADLAEGRVRTKEEYLKDFFKNNTIKYNTSESNKVYDFNPQTEPSIVEEPKEKPLSFQEWMLKDSVRRGTGNAQLEYNNYLDKFESSFKYGGDLPKAQFGPPYDWMQQFQQQQQQLINPQGIQDYFKNMGQTNYAEDTRAVANAQLQQRFPELGPTPEQQAAQDLFRTETGIASDPTVAQTATAQPTVTRKRNLGNAFNQIETFIKDNPAMRAYGDVSQAAVMGANLANEWFAEKEYRDYKNKLRNSTTADKIYTAKANPLNKRGTFDVNLGLAEPDNLVDYYAQAMYGKEMYKKGGEFVPHMMYDPVSGEAYEAKVEADHNRFAKMGFVHQDEMQTGGEIEVDNDTLAALIAAGADIEML